MASREVVASELGVTHQRIEQIERVALEKVRIAIELEEELGARVGLVFVRLRGRSLADFRKALQALREGRA